MQQLTFSSVFLSADLSLLRRASILSSSALSLCSFCREPWRSATLCWSSSLSLCSCWELPWACSSASCCCFRLWDTVQHTTSKWSLNFYTFIYIFTSVWLTSFSVLLCFSSSEFLSSESSWALWRIWVRSVSVWFSLLISERASRVLSRRSYGHMHGDILFKGAGKSWELFLAVYCSELTASQQNKRFIPRMWCFCLLSIFKVQSQTKTGKLSWEALGELMSLPEHFIAQSLRSFRKTTAANVNKKCSVWSWEGCIAAL